MSLEAVLSHLENEGVGVQGKTLFVNFIPNDLPGILLRHPFGGQKFDHELPGYMKTSFMLISRARGYNESRALSLSAIEAFKVIAGKEIDGLVFRYARARAEPFPFAPSPGQNNEFHTTIDLNYVDTSVARP